MAMTLRLDGELDARLTTVAEHKRLSKQQVVVQAVERFLREDSHRATVLALAEKAAVDYPETLRRLGE